MIGPLWSWGVFAVWLVLSGDALAVYRVAYRIKTGNWL